MIELTQGDIILAVIAVFTWISGRPPKEEADKGYPVTFKRRGNSLAWQRPSAPIIIAVQLTRPV